MAQVRAPALALLPRQVGSVCNESARGRLVRPTSELRNGVPPAAVVNNIHDLLSPVARLLRHEEVSVCDYSPLLVVRAPVLLAVPQGSVPLQPLLQLSGNFFR